MSPNSKDYDCIISALNNKLLGLWDGRPEDQSILNMGSG